MTRDKAALSGQRVTKVTRVTRDPRELQEYQEMWPMLSLSLVSLEHLEREEKRESRGIQEILVNEECLVNKALRDCPDHRDLKVTLALKGRLGDKESLVLQDCRVHRVPVDCLAMRASLEPLDHLE